MGSANQQTKFDFIIVGGMCRLQVCYTPTPMLTSAGGTAGNAVAGRLAENPDVSVAVIEAGPEYDSFY